VSGHLAYVGIGTNLGDRFGTIARALSALQETGTLLRRSSIYRTAPWGVANQPEFLNAVACVETSLSPHALLAALKGIERRLGREPAERWGPRTIDLDLLVYDDLRIADLELTVPHARLAERAFALVPLAELDDRFAAMRDALDPSQRAGVARIDEEQLARFDATAGESGSEMHADEPLRITERVRALAEFLSRSDLVRLRVERGDEAIELTAGLLQSSRSGASGASASADTRAVRTETLKADLVGIFHLGRPTPAEGEVFESDRELGYIEALGIRTPVHSMGAGRLVTICAKDQSPVEYGQALFSIARA
jgi:2-amino-4-hydroxy-6-hydroxymethyldihydropteridine diphosphokinase